MREINKLPSVPTSTKNDNTSANVYIA